MGWGLRAVVSTSFADIFKGNSYQAGLLPVELPAETVSELIVAAEDPAASVTIDLESRTVRCGAIEARFDIDSDVRERLMKGLDAIGLTMEHAEALSAYEASRADWLPRSVTE